MKVCIRTADYKAGNKYDGILELYKLTEEDKEKYIEINNLEELLTFAKKIDENIIICHPKYNVNVTDDLEIEIYDDYRE